MSVKTLYFDCFSGISGDMTIGALLDVGLDFDFLKTELDKLPIDGFDVRLSRVERASISAAKFDVLTTDDVGHSHNHSHKHDHDDAHAHGHEGHSHRRASQIMDMIRGSRLSAPVRKRAVEIFEKLAISEGQVHQMPPEDVEFHEVGAVDSIVDIVGAAIGLESIGVDRFLCSPINIGGGFIHCQHGVYPVPAPATASLLAHAPIYSRHVEAELVTPTGAAILAATIDRFGPMDGFRIDTVGYGAGSKSFDNFPNCLRLFRGTEDERPASDPRAFDSSASDLSASDLSDGVVVIEANIDDMSAENLAYAAEKLIEVGALDVLTIPVLMKKGRPGHLLQVIAPTGLEDDMSRTMFEETTTIGVRMRPTSRRVLDRETVQVSTPGGPVSVKVSSFRGKIVNVSPEYEDCARLARSSGRPFKDVQAEALKLYLERKQTGESNENG
jgi:hypothetical protein